MSMNRQEDGIYQKAAEMINKSDAVLISASNGLSISEGYHIFADNDDFKKYFGAFREKYGVDSLIRGVFTPMTEADRKSYMETVHRYLIDDYSGSAVMKDLLKMLKDKEYFIITSNGDTHFQINGFDTNRIFEIEGNFDGLQEHDKTWNEQADRFRDFVQKFSNGSLLVLELGIGARNSLIKAPLMQMVAEHNSWHYITLNMPGEIFVPSGIADRSIAIPGNIAETFTKIIQRSK